MGVGGVVKVGEDCVLLEGVSMGLFGYLRWVDYPGLEACRCGVVFGGVL